MHKPHLDTRAAQALRRLSPATGAVTPPLDQSATFARDADYKTPGPYVYARDGGETQSHLEALMADLEGAATSLAFSSGMSAITAVIETLPQGAHVSAPSTMYHGTLTLLREHAATGRLRITLFDPAAPGDFGLREDTLLLWLETPTNPTWDILSIAEAAALRPANCLLAVDSTVAPPCTTQPLAHGADISFHSATKYLGGHSDLAAGILSLARPDLAPGLTAYRSRRGTRLAPFEAWLLIRGIRTLPLRFARASETARTIAAHFEHHPRIARVLYPGLPSHPGHARAAAQMQGGFSGLLSLLTDTEETAARTVRKARIWIPATSLGSVESLIEHRRPIEPPESTVPPTLLRLSTGIENAEDLIEDLEQALRP